MCYYAGMNDYAWTTITILIILPIVELSIEVHQIVLYIMYIVKWILYYTLRYFITI